MNNIKKAKGCIPEYADAAVISDPVLRFWVTGFPSSAGVLIIGREKCLLLVDFRYFEAAQAALSGEAEVILLSKKTEQMKDALRGMGAEKVAFVDDKTSWREAAQLKEQLSEFECLFEKDFAEALAAAAMIKQEYELDLMREAQRITDEAFAAVLPRICAGMSENELAALLEYEMKMRGAQGASFDFIVVSGAKTSMPHGVPSEHKIEENALLTMDIGVKYGGYCSDMTRTVAVGEVGAEEKKIYEVVLAAQKAALAAIKPGVKCCDIDKIARDIINNAGYEGCFGHGLGHSLGVQVHESPSFSSKCDAVLEPGMVLSVEPGIYIPGRFGVRIEDVVIITAGGCENITASPKELIVI